MTEYISFEAAREQQKRSPAPRWHKPAAGDIKDPALASTRFGERLFAPRLPAPKFRLSRDDRFFMIGSCFARGLEAALTNLKFSVLSLSDDFNGHDLAVQGMTPLGATNKYNIHAINNEIRWAFGEERFPESGIVEVSDGTFYDPHMTPVFAPADRDTVMRRREIMTGIVRRALDANVVILTLGLIEVWKDMATGLVTNSTPDPRAIRRHPGRFVFGRLDYQENLDLLRGLHQTIRTHGQPGVRFIVTVSPVPLEATFTDRDVVEATTYSKSLLRVVAEDFVSRHDDAEYFPSFEIVMNSPRPNAWIEDCRHVRGEVANFIMRQFVGHFIPDETVDATSKLVTAGYVG